MTFSISYSTSIRRLMTPMALGPRHSSVEVRPDTVVVHMGWAFSATIPRGSIVAAQPTTAMRRPSISRGVHGFRGRYLVNGSGDGLVTITIDPPARARMIGLPVQLRELIVSVDDPDGLIGALVPRSV